MEEIKREYTVVIGPITPQQKGVNYWWMNYDAGSAHSIIGMGKTPIELAWNLSRANYNGRVAFTRWLNFIFDSGPMTLLEWLDNELVGEGNVQISAGYGLP